MYHILAKIKGFIIAFLVFLAIYQTVNLWFEDFSNHRFFYTLKTNTDKSSLQNNVEYNTKSIIINIGNNRFIQNFNDITKSDYKQVADEAIALSIKRGKFTEPEYFDLNLALDKKCIIYNYSYSIEGQEIATIFNSNNKNLSKIEKFDLIAILPNLKKTDQIQVIFFDTIDLRQYEFSLNSSFVSSVQNIINKFKVHDEYYYLSSFKSGFDLFKKNQFILNWDNTSLKYNKVNLINPVMKDSVLSPKLLEAYINIFFENPSVKWYLPSDDDIIFSDETTVVKYFKNSSVLEYSDYKRGENQDNTKVFERYNTAINFLNTDTNIKNEYYLKDYSKDQDKITFYFDYKINNMPIYLSEVQKANTGMQSMIEITVSQNRVSKYKRIVYDFYSDEKTSFFYKDFLTTIDNIIYKNYNNKKNYSINKIELAYNFKPTKDDEKMSIGWFVQVGDKIFFQN